MKSPSLPTPENGGKASKDKAILLLLQVGVYIRPCKESFPFLRMRD